MTGDEHYGNDGGLPALAGGRWAGVRAGRGALAPRPAGGRQVRAEALADGLPSEAWQRIVVGAGSKGPRVYDWARGRLQCAAEAGWAQWLLVRRSVARPDDLAFYRAFGPTTATAVDLARVAGRRRAIEEGFRRAKEVGLDQYEVRRWEGWRRHSTLCLLAHAFLAATRAAARGEKGGPPT